MANYQKSTLTEPLGEFSNAQLHTARLLLKPLASEDRWLYQALYTDPKIMRNTAEPFSPDKVDRMFNRTLKIIASLQPEALVWTINQQSDGKTVGIICLYEMCYQQMTSKVGVMLLREANGKLYPEEALQAVVDFSFESLNLAKIIGEFWQRNLASKRFALKTGFKLMAEPHPDPKQLYCALSRSDWLTAKT